MPIRRKLEEAVPTLLRLVEELEPILRRLIHLVDQIVSVDKFIEHSKTQDSLLEKIKIFFDNKKKDWLQVSEEDLLESFTALEKEIYENYNSTDGSRGSPAHLAGDAGNFKSLKDEGFLHKVLRFIDKLEPILSRRVDEVERSKTQDSVRLKKIKDNLEQLGKIKTHLKLLEKIKGFFDKDGADLFDALKRRENEILKNFTSLEQEIDDSKYSIGGSISEVNFDSIKEGVSEFKVLPLKKTEAEHKNSESEAPAREISEKWRELKVEGEILKSAAMSRLRWNYEDIVDHKMLIAAKDIENHKILTHLKDEDESKEYKGYKEHIIPAYKIKLCLLCFSIFPAKSVIKKRPLIYWWLGEGLIDDTEEGERIFWELIRKGFLTAEHKPHKTGQGENPTVDSCTMHPWNLRMLISVAKSAEFFDFDDHTGLPAADKWTKSRRRCLVKQLNPQEQAHGNVEDLNQGGAEQRAQNSSSSTMVTLFNVNEQYLNIDLKSFSDQNKLVVLQLGRWQESAKHHIEVENEEFLKALGTKKHLKYLSLRGISRITAIPSSVKNLLNLEILDLRACHNLEKLPSDISSLKKLKHLDISECHLLESMPKGLEKLTSLEVLKGFVVTTSKQSHCKLENLAGKLDKLRKLTIYIRNEDRKEDLTQLKDLNELNKFKSVRILSITWGGAPASTEKTEKPALTEKPTLRMPSMKHSTGKPASTEKTLRTPSMKHLTGKPASTEKTLRMSSMKYSAEKPASRAMPVSLPPELKKLDLWCIPEEHPDWLTPGKLQSLRKLYIRGGKLVNFQGSSSRVQSSVEKWRVQILRLKYLRDFKEDETKLRQLFPRLVYMEIENKAKDDSGASSSGS